MRIQLALLIGVILVFSRATQAFPELVKHGYTNCMACHVSPTGGGVLTEYGRALSKELLSTWGREGEEKFLWLVPTTQTVALGGDVRAVHIIDDGPRGKRKRDIVMQKDLEGAVTVGKFTAAGTIGTYDPQSKNEDKFLSRRHYAIYQATESVSVRAGRFYPYFGLYIPEHTSAIRRGLGWDQNMESYNLEGAWQVEKWNLFVTGIFGRPDQSILNREAGGAVTLAHNPTDKMKVAASYYYGETDEVTHHYVGPWAVLGFSEKLALLTQATAARTFVYTANSPTWGLVTYNRLDYEFYKGMHAYLAHEFSQLNFERNSTRLDSLAVALQFFPRPHFEFQAIYSKTYEQQFRGRPTDRTLFLAHFYP